MEQVKNEKKQPSYFARIKRMDVGETIRIDICRRGGIRPMLYAYSAESKKRFRTKTAQNKNSFTITRIE